VFSFFRCRSESVTVMYCCIGQEGELSGAGASCNSVRRCCVHAKVVSSFLRILINVLGLNFRLMEGLRSIHSMPGVR